MELLIFLLIHVVFGAIVGAIAQSRGRSGIGWFCIGFFFGCISLVLVLVLPDVRAQEAEQIRLRRENRRLRERVKKDRLVSDQRHDDVDRRLGVHDRALGVDTQGRIGHDGEFDELSAPPPPPGSGSGSSPYEILWHVQVNTGDTRGPMNFESLQDLWDAGEASVNTFVWHDGLTDWARIASLPELRQALDE